jgi:hypothetical protein
MMHPEKLSWKAFLKKNLSRLLHLGGLAALMYVADYYFNGSKAFNAVVSALGQHHLKLQTLLPFRALDWIKTKLHLHPRSLQGRFWKTMMRVVRQQSPTLLCRKLGLCAGGRPGPPEAEGRAGRAGRAEAEGRVGPAGGGWLHYDDPPGQRLDRNTPGQLSTQPQY